MAGRVRNGRAAHLPTWLRHLCLFFFPCYVHRDTVGRLVLSRWHLHLCEENGGRSEPNILSLGRPPVLHHHPLLVLKPGVQGKRAPVCYSVLVLLYIHEK